MPQPMMPKPCWAMVGSVMFEIRKRRSHQTNSGDVALAVTNDQPIGYIDQCPGVRDGFPLRTDIEPALLDYLAGLGCARIEFKLLDQDGREDTALGIEQFGRE